MNRFSEGRSFAEKYGFGPHPMEPRIWTHSAPNLGLTGNNCRNESSNKLELQQ